MLKRGLIIFILFICVFGIASTTDYYVDSQAGNDVNSGTSQLCCEECQFHLADTNENERIDVDEMVDMIADWRLDNNSIPELMEVIELWKIGC